MRLSCAVLLCALALPSAAAADVVVTVPAERELLVQGGDGSDEIRITRVTGEGEPAPQGELVISAEGQTVRDEADGCQPAGDTVRCELQKNASSGFVDMHVSVRGAGGDDVLADEAGLVVSGFWLEVELLGEAGADRLSGVHGTSLSGGGGPDRVEGGRMTGDEGDDTLISLPVVTPTHFRQEPGADLYVTRSTDIFHYTDGPVSLSLDAVANDGAPGEGDNIGNQAARIEGSPAGDRIDVSTAQGHGVAVHGRDGHDEIVGSPMRDFLWGGLGRDRIQGAGGDDQLWIGDFDDIAGGEGRDELQTTGFANGGYVAPSFDVSLDGVANDGERPSATSNVHPDVEVVYGGNSADRLVGGAGAQELHGGDGDDVLEGGTGPDLLYGGPGADLLRGRDGGWDQLDCGEGSDPAAEGDEGDHLVGCELSQLAPLPDRRAPFIGISSVRRRATALRVRTYSDEKTALVAELRAGGRRLARRTLGAALGARAFSLPLSRSDRRRLRRLRFATVSVTATDAAGNASTRTRRTRLR